MLIVAIPKSASTSLMVTLAGMYGKPYKQFYSDWGKAVEYVYLHNLHSDCKEINAESAKYMGFHTKNQVFKNHLPPTNNNINLLKDVKKVILLREPIEIIPAYKRSFEKGFEDYSFFKESDDFKGLKTEKEWIERSIDLELLNDLYRFFYGWRNVELLNDCLIITYNELINNTEITIRKITQYFGMHNKHKKIVLAKKRYTRD
jgi:hypothetical protein